MSATTLQGIRRPRRTTLLAAGREQALLASGQLLAGIGNLAFALVCAHVLAPGQYSHLAAFLAAYLLLYMPFSALAAGAALDPAESNRRRRHSLAIGSLVALPLVATGATGLGPDIGLSASLLVILASAAPVAGHLALERGRALGDGRSNAAIASLLAEPLLRLGLGVPAAARFGAPGAAAAVVIGGYAASLAAARGTEPLTAPSARPARPSGARSVTVAFGLLAVLQNQDILWANAQLNSSQASLFAVLSTLGGMAAFASTTVPLVLLPRVRRGERGALPVAIGAAAALGLAAVVPMAFEGGAIIGTIFGPRYSIVAPLVVAYLLAMALLGVSRVLVAHRCAVRSPRPVLLLLAICAIVQAGLIALLGDSAGDVSHATLAACAGLTAGLGILALRGRRQAPRRESDALDGPPHDISSASAPAGAVEPVELAPERTRHRPKPPARRRASIEPTLAPPARARARARRPSSATVAVLALTAVGLILRLLAGRSFWLDEATSVTQARMPFSAMLTSLRTSDVQPPLHDVLLWVINRVVGDSETAMRSPSLLAGTALIPLLYWIGRDLWDRRTGLIAAGLIAVAPFVVWYSQEARMYAVFMLVANLALWAQVRILRDPEDAEDRWRWRWWLLYSLSTAAMAWTQYFGALVALAQQGVFVVAIVARPGDRRTLIIPWLASMVVIAACVAPLLPFVMHQYQVNQASGKGFGATPSQTGTDLEAGHTKPTVYAALTNLIWGLWGYHSTVTMAALTALWPVGILLTLALLGRGRSWRVAVLLAFAAVPVVILFVVGQFKPFLFEIRYFCAGVPVVVLLLARLCSSWAGRRTMGSVALGAALAASFLFAFTDQQFSQTNPRIYDFQGALNRIQQQMRRGDELLYAPQYLNDLVGYYEPHMRSAPLTADPSRVAPHGRVFVMASFQQQPQNAHFVRSAIDRLLTAHRSQIGAFRRPQVQVWEFR